MPGSPLQKFKSAFNKKIRPSSLSSRSNSEMSSEHNLSFEEPPLTPLELDGYKPSTRHRLLDVGLGEEIRQHIPSLLQISHNWKLLYSIEQSGTSLHTLYSNCGLKIGENPNRRRGYILVVQDTNKNKFGAYLNENLRPLDGKYYYGNGDCFLWKLEKGTIKDLDNNTEHEIDMNLKVFPYTSLNGFIIYSNHEFISVGSGNGKFGLWIDSNLSIGASDSVDTFGNEPLSDKRKFHILGLEIWKVI